MSTTHNLDVLIDKFNNISKIEVLIDEKLTLDVIQRKRDELDAIAKRLKFADKVLLEIYEAYTLMLEIERFKEN